MKVYIVVGMYAYEGANYIGVALDDERAREEADKAVTEDGFDFAEVYEAEVDPDNPEGYYAPKDTEIYLTSKSSHERKG